MQEDTSAPIRAIVPADEKTVDFYGEPIPVALGPDGTLYVRVDALIDFLRLSHSGQHYHIRRDPVLAEQVQFVRWTSNDGKRYGRLCLPLDLIPRWLTGIGTKQVKPELQEKLKHYRAECFRVLSRAFEDDPALRPLRPQRTEG